MIIILFIILVISFLIVWDSYGFKDARKVKCSKQFNGPLLIPIFGNALMYLFRSTEDVLTLGDYFFNNYGDTVRIWAFKRLVFLSRDPRFFEVLLSSQKQLTKNNLYEFLNDWLGNGLLLSTGQKWITRRKIITPTFHFKILQQFVDIFNYQNDIFVKKLKAMKSEKSFDIYNIVTSMSLDIISQTAMGVEINSQNQNSEYARAVKEMTYIISDRVMYIWKRPRIIFNLTNDKKRYDKCLRILHEFTRKIIEKRRETIINEKENFENIDDDSIGIKKKLALLDVLLKSNVNGCPLTNAEIAEEVDTFMFEGHDTITAATTFTLYLLSQNHEIQQKAYEEVMRIVGDDLNTKPTYNQLLDMKYLECVIKESLRLYPPVPIIGRNLDEDLEVDGKLIPAGVNFNMMIYHLNMDPKYFKNPERFNPERFNSENVRNENPFLYVPFSAGSRNCIGQKFAMLELKCTLCNVLRNFELLKGDVELKVISTLTLKSKTGVHVGFKQRY